MKLLSIASHYEGQYFERAIIAFGRCYDYHGVNGFYFKLESPFTKMIEDYMSPADYIVRPTLCRRGRMLRVRRVGWKNDPPPKFRFATAKCWMPA